MYLSHCYSVSGPVGGNKVLQDDSECLVAAHVCVDLPLCTQPGSQHGEMKPCQAAHTLHKAHTAHTISTGITRTQNLKRQNYSNNNNDERERERERA